MQPVEYMNPPENTTVPTLAKPGKTWSLRDIRGARADILTEIAASQIPAEWRAAIVADINALPATVKYVRLDCHWHQSAMGKTVLHLDIAPWG
jgi:hypothetical protein